jgi:hypothetical protein
MESGGQADQDQAKEYALDPDTAFAVRHRPRSPDPWVALVIHSSRHPYPVVSGLAVSE